MSAGVGPSGVVRKWNYPVDRWKELLAAAGFAAQADIVAAPDGEEAGTLLVHAAPM
jgi:hypothetical protein